MNLGVIETHLQRALQQRLGAAVDVHTGPVHGRPASGLRAEVFIHAARYADGGGLTADGAVVARRPVAEAGGVSGFAEERPALIDIDVTCVCGQHAQALTLAGLVAAPLLVALETLQAVPLGDPTDPLQRLQFGDHVALLQAGGSSRQVHDGVALAQAMLTIRLQGFLQLRLLRKGGLPKTSPYDWPLHLTLQADPAGVDLQAEHVALHNDGDNTLDLGGWSITDAAPRRPHRYVFAAGRLLPAGATLRLYSGRGVDSAGRLYWGRRQAVWTNTGDLALLLDPDGVERARVAYIPPAPPAAKPVTARRRR